MRTWKARPAMTPTARVTALLRRTAASFKRTRARPPATRTRARSIGRWRPDAMDSVHQRTTDTARIGLDGCLTAAIASAELMGRRDLSDRLLVIKNDLRHP